MRSIGRRNSAARVGLIGLACVAFLTACEQEGTATPADVPVDVGETADIGAALESDQWTVTLIDTPYTTEMVGAGGGEHYQWQDVGTAEAEGIFVILPVELTNASSEIQMLHRASGLVVADEQGREAELAKGRPHQTLVYTSERWGEFENQIFQNPMEAGVTWEGPLVFDVPDDATGLTLRFRGSDQSIDLGL